jgi:hypothetical protein
MALTVCSSLFLSWLCTHHMVCNEQYAQWRVFMDGGIKTSKQAAEFTSAVGREALATVLSDVPLKR